MDQAQPQFPLPFWNQVKNILPRMLNEGFEDISAADK